MSIQIGISIVDGFSKAEGSRHVGYGVDMAKIACQYSGLNCTFVFYESIHYGSVDSNGTASGLFGVVQRGDIDTTMPIYGPTYSRFRALDFSHSLAFPSVMMITRALTLQTDQLSNNAIYAFQWPVLLAFLLALLMTSAVIASLRWTSPTALLPRIFLNTLSLLTFDHKISALTGTGARIVVISWTLSCVVLSSVYKNELFSSKVALSKPPFVNLETLAACLESMQCRIVTSDIHSAHYAELTKNGSSLSNRFDLALTKNPPLIVRDQDTIPEMILAENRYYLVMFALNDQFLMNNDGNSECKFYAVDAAHFPAGYAFPVRKGSKKILKKLNRLASRYRESGINNAVLRKYTGVSKNAYCRQQRPKSLNEESRGLQSVRIVFLVYGVGISISLLLFAAEVAVKMVTV